MDFPILSSVIFLPLLGAFFILIFKTENDRSSKYISIFTSFANLILCLFLWFSFDNTFSGFPIC